MESSLVKGKQLIQGFLSPCAGGQTESVSEPCNLGATGLCQSWWVWDLEGTLEQGPKDGFLIVECYDEMMLTRSGKLLSGGSVCF